MTRELLEQSKQNYFEVQLKHFLDVLASCTPEKNVTLEKAKATREQLLNGVNNKVFNFSKEQEQQLQDTIDAHFNRFYPQLAHDSKQQLKPLPSQPRSGERTPPRKRSPRQTLLARARTNEDLPSDQKKEDSVAGGQSMSGSKVFDRNTWQTGKMEYPVSNQQKHSSESDVSRVRQQSPQLNTASQTTMTTPIKPIPALHPSTTKAGTLFVPQVRQPVPRLSPPHNFSPPSPIKPVTQRPQVAQRSVVPNSTSTATTMSKSSTPVLQRGVIPPRPLPPPVKPQTSQPPAHKPPRPLFPQYAKPQESQQLTYNKPPSPGSRR